jgi:outer membrane lipoprotein SlyB
MVGGGAVIGTIIGAIVGHGKGAAIGAAVGAAGGAGAQVLTKGKQVIIPAETVLQFNLDQAVTLAPER